MGVSHEVAVKDLLVEYGWNVQPWGQGLWTERIRADLQMRYPPTLWRWIPDMIATRGPRAILVDPKTEWRIDTPNFSIEQSALIAHQDMAHLGLDIVYVFSGFLCNWMPRIAVSFLSTQLRQETKGGSGTPFALIPKSDCVPLADVFGQSPVFDLGKPLQTRPGGFRREG